MVCYHPIRRLSKRNIFGNRSSSQSRTGTLRNKKRNRNSRNNTYYDRYTATKRAGYLLYDESINLSFPRTFFMVSTLIESNNRYVN